MSTDFYYEYNESGRDPYLDLEVPSQISFEVSDLDISIVNGIRRVLQGEVPCLSISPEIQMTEEDNLTAFNTQYLQDRLSMQPIHLENPELISEFRELSRGAILLKICDPDDPNRPLQNLENAPRHILAKDIQVFEEYLSDRLEDQLLPEGLDQLLPEGMDQLPEGLDQLPGKMMEMEENSQQNFQRRVQTEFERLERDDEEDEFTQEELRNIATERVQAQMRLEGEAEQVAMANEAEAAASAQASAEAQKTALEVSQEPVALPGTSIGIAPGAERGPPVQLQQYPDTFYRRVPNARLFRYPDMYLATLQKGEHLHMTMQPEVGVGQEHARWTSALVTYRFKPRKGNQVDDPEYWKNPEYQPNRDRQDYRKAASPAGKYGAPDRFQISVEYNGHYRPALAWNLSVGVLRDKIAEFRQRLMQITEVRSGEVSPGLQVYFPQQTKVDNLIQFYIDNEDHTLGNILFSHYLYALEELVQVKQDVTGETDPEPDMLRSFSHYNIPHPLEKRMIFQIKVPKWDSKILDQAFQQLLQKEMERRTPVPKYTEDIYTKAPSLRLLMIVLDRLLATLTQLKNSLLSKK